MKNIIILLSLILLTACVTDSDPKEDVFEPYRNGTWLVTSPNMAEWEGEKGKLGHTTVQDTIVYNTPNQQQLNIISSGNDGKFKFTYIDSTSLDWTRIDLSNTVYKMPVYDQPNLHERVSSGGRSASIGEDAVKIEFNMSWRCGYQLVKRPVLSVHFPYIESDSSKSYIFVVTGMDDTLNDIAC